MKKYNIAVVGRFDCNNYGNLMLSIVLKKQIENRLPIGNLFFFASNSAFIDLTTEKISVYPIDKIEDINSEYKLDAIILSGGDLIQFDGNYNFSEEEQPVNAAYDLIVFTAAVAAKMNIPVIWNALGVPFNFSTAEGEIVKELVDNLVDYFTVRDNISADLIRRCGVSKQIDIVPDTVFSVSDLIDSKNEFDKLSNEFDFLTDEYIIFQPVCNCSSRDIKSIAGRLKTISSKANKKIVLLPFEYSDSDDGFLKELFSVQNNEAFFRFNRKLSALEITSVIANSYAFIGTSLYGNIVANSYCVPNMCIDLEGSAELKSFFELQERERYYTDSINNLPSIFSELIVKPEFSKVEKSKALISGHYDNIVEIIKNGISNQKKLKTLFDLCYVFFPYCSETFEIYFDTSDGAGFSPKHKYVISLSEPSNRIDLELKLPKDTRAILIRPTKKSSCALDNFVFFADGKELEPVGNYIMELSNSGYYVFLNTNPEMIINLPKDIKNIHISCDVSLFLSMANAKKSYDQLLKEKTEVEKEYIRFKKSYKKLLNAYTETRNSFFWRITAIPRRISTHIKQPIKHFIKVLRRSDNVFSTFLVKVLSFLRRKNRRIIISHSISKKRRVFEENYKFKKNIKISILVPLYNTPKRFLVEMIESVRKQTYKNFELCLADGSDKKHAYVGRICRRYSKSDNRIVYSRLAENKGISENTNECIRMSTGDYIALFDHDDVLHPSALFECMKAICDNGAEYVYTDEAVFLGKNINKIVSCHFKSDYATDTLLANNYICHFSVFKASLLDIVGSFRHEYDGSQDHDIILRLTDAAKIIVHIPKVLYFWRSHSNSVAKDISSKLYTIESGKKAVHDFLESKGFDVVVSSSPAFPVIYKIDYKINGSPLVSIIIPTKNNLRDLKSCINSICSLTKYSNYEIVIVDNGTSDTKVYEYYKKLQSNYKIKIVMYSKQLNYSLLNNFAASVCDGDYLLFLNDDTKIITNDWLEQMLMYAQRDDVGAVGAKLLLPNNTIQHGGIILGLGPDRVCGYGHYGMDASQFGYMGKMYYVQNVSAVSSACLMVKKSKFDEVGGFDEQLAVAFNDVDFCLKLREKGYLNVFNPFCELFHYESSVSDLEKDRKKYKDFIKEKKLFLAKWKKTIDLGDPYYNPNFSLDDGYQIKTPIDN